LPRPDFARFVYNPWPLDGRFHREGKTMTNTLLPALFVAGMLSLPALAADPHTITMSGHGEVKAVPDIAILNAGVTTNAPTAAAALSANSVRMNQLFEALRKLGIPDRNIQTTGFSVSPQYSNGDGNNPRRLTGYQAVTRSRFG
jgi:hypothetical protein